MSLSIVLVCAWALAANVLAMMPSRDHHWTRAYWLIGIGLPLLGFVYWQHGIWAMLLALAAGASVLRWPLRYLWRRVKGRIPT